MNGIYRNNFQSWVTVKNNVITEIDYYGNQFAGYKPVDDAPEVGKKVDINYLKKFGYMVVR